MTTTTTTTTTTTHLKLERGRFARHVKATLASVLPLAWRTGPGTGARPVMSASDALDVEVATEAQRVRDLAHSYSKTDPGFAADLYAAASRHEARG